MSENATNATETKPAPAQSMQCSGQGWGFRRGTLTAVEGVIISVRLIEKGRMERYPLIGRKGFRWRRGAPKPTWSVRIRTREGWILAGYIGTAETPEGLPDIRVGDAVTTNPLCTVGPDCPYYGMHTERGEWWTASLGRVIHGRIRRGRDNG